MAKEPAGGFQFFLRGGPQSPKRPSVFANQGRELVGKNSSELARSVPNVLPPPRQDTYALPRLPMRSRTRWNRIAMASLFAGAGIAFAAAAVIAFVSWYNGRPVPWNAAAIRAHYDKTSYSLELEDWYQDELNRRDEGQPQDAPKGVNPSGWVTQLGAMTVQICYDMENSSNVDYTLEPPQAAGLFAMQRLKSTGTLVDGKRLKWSATEPFHHEWIPDRKGILIPAHQTVRVYFFMDYVISDDDAFATSVRDWNKAGVEQEFARHELGDTESFVIFDQAHHYQIELPLEEVSR
jgi:hypothetical protein